MNELINYWAKTNYTELVLIITLFTALIISIQKRKKFKLLRLFPFYISSLLMVYLCAGLLAALKNRFQVDHYLDYFFTLIELLFFTFFFVKVIHSPVKKTIIILEALLFVPFFFYQMATDKAFLTNINPDIINKIYTIEAILLLIPCMFYFFELFKQPPTLDLKNEPAFWIIVGLFFFMVGTLPYSLMENYLRINYRALYMQLYSIFYIFYILLFIMIIKAYLCKPVVT